MLAAHAAVAIENARLYERSREASVIEERNRLARELHDSVSQTLFGIALTAEAAATTVDEEPHVAKRQLETLRDSARAAHHEMRSLIFELRPAALESDGLVPTLRKHVDVLRRVTHKEIELRDADYTRQPPKIEGEAFRILQEALNNAVQHSSASRIEIELVVQSGRLRIAVSDDGIGFQASDPRIRGRRLGITSMEERAEGLGGHLHIASAVGGGTRVELEVPVD